MPGVTFGDLIRSAEQQIEAAERYRGSVTADPGEIARQLQRLSLAVVRYLDDPLSRASLVLVSEHRMAPEDRALLDLRQALLVTAESLESLIPKETTPDLRDPCTRRLAGAADALAAGRDLINTHYSTAPDGTRIVRSFWAPALASHSFVTAIMAEAVPWAARVARWTRWLASHADTRLTDPSDMLSHAEAAFDAAALRPGEYAALLREVPSATPPSPVEFPDRGESDEELCAGIAVSSERLRAAVFAMPDRAAWSGEISGPAWEHAARAGALVCHMSEVAMTMLLDRHAGECEETKLRTAIAAFTDARMAWMHGVDSWRLATTDTRTRVTPVTAEADSLVLRIGRLVYDHPQWTPQRSKDIKFRDSIGLPPERIVLSVLHDANDAIARMASSDLRIIGAALAAQRIYVPSRTVSLSYATVARPYVRMSGDRSGSLLDTYKAIVKQSQLALHALDEVVLNEGAPSKVLALARKAAAPQHEARADSVPSSDPPYHPGPLENMFRKTGASDPGLLLRANAIDKATRELLADARDVAGVPARLAAKDSPAGADPVPVAPDGRNPRSSGNGSPAITRTRRHT